jgi:FtsH-binding integral membrane protein
VNPSQTGPTGSPFAFDAIPAERAAFIRRTYAHVGGAILAFTLVELLIFQTGLPDFEMQFLGVSRYAWLMVMLGFMGISKVAEQWATSDASQGMQYAGLGLYVLAEALIFTPLLWIAQYYAGPPAIQSAVMLTLMLFTGLTVAVFATQADFSWMSTSLCVGGFVAFGLIVCSIVLGFQLGTLFSGAMILLAAGSILYQTSNVMRRYRTDQHVAASLALFASVALLFWYVLRIFIALRRR